MKRAILFLEQQSWRGGAERVLEAVLSAVGPEFAPLVAFPKDGPFAADLRRRDIETLLFPLGDYRAGPKSLPDMIAFGPRSLNCAWRLAKIIRQRNVRLVYINSPRCLLAGVIAARLTGRPSLFHLHMTMTRRADLIAATRAAWHATKIVACSKTSATALSRFDRRLNGRIQVIYNPVRKPAAAASATESSSALAASVTRSSDFLIGHVGRVTPQKGQHILLKAAALLKNRGLNIRVLLVGAPEEQSAPDASYARTLERLTRELGLADRVHWTGYQENPDIFYRLFDALVIPSTVSEGLPMVALEALQWGVPVIGSNVGGIPEVVRDGVNGFLVPPSDAPALANRLERLLSNPELRAQLRAGARASVDGRFSFDNFRRDLRQVLSELVVPPSSVDKASWETADAHR